MPRPLNTYSEWEILRNADTRELRVMGKGMRNEASHSSPNTQKREHHQKFEGEIGER